MRALDRFSLARIGGRRCRTAVEIGHEGRPEYLAAIESLADEHERTLASDEHHFYWARATGALFGDDYLASLSFIRLPPPK